MASADAMGQAPPENNRGADNKRQRSNDRFFCVYRQALLLVRRARNAPSRRATSAPRSLSAGVIFTRHRRKRPRLFSESNKFRVGPKASFGMGFAWFIWDAAHVGPAEVDRISWDPIP
jgi:hypothetical protein